MSDFNGWDFDNSIGNNRKKMKYVVVMAGDLDVTNAVGCTSLKDVQLTVDHYDDYRPIEAVFKVEDITSSFVSR